VGAVRRGWSSVAQAFAAVPLPRDTLQMADGRRHDTEGFDTPATIRDSLDGEWSQEQFGDAFHVSTLHSNFGLDPTGSAGILREVLTLFYAVLEPETKKLEWCLCSPGSEAQILFEVHRLKSASDQLGALRIAQACFHVERHFACNAVFGEVWPNEELAVLVEVLLEEVMRVQRRLRTLLHIDQSP
jgi:hypothetical protein